MSTAKKSSLMEIHPHTKSGTDQISVPSYGIIIFLILALLVIKGFIYIKDPKRHDK